MESTRMVSPSRRAALALAAAALAAVAAGCRDIEFRKSWRGDKAAAARFRVAHVEKIKMDPPAGLPSEFAPEDGAVEIERESQAFAGSGAHFETKLAESDWGLYDRGYRQYQVEEFRRKLQHGHLLRDGAFMPFQPDPDAPLPPHAARIRPEVIDFDPGSKFLRMFPFAGAMTITMKCDLVDPVTDQVVASAIIESETTGGGYTTGYEDVTPILIEKCAAMLDEAFGPMVSVRSQPPRIFALNEASAQAARAAQAAGASGVAKAADKPQAAKIQVEYPYETTTSSVDLIVHVSDPQRMTEVSAATLDGRNAGKAAVKEEQVKVSLTLAKGSNVVTVLAKNDKGEPVASVDIEIVRHK